MNQRLCFVASPDQGTAGEDQTGSSRTLAFMRLEDLAFSADCHTT
jgi:hypothetical protein